MSNSKFYRLSFFLVTFLSQKTFTFAKVKKQGRVKRKIRRRLIKLNNITD